MSPNENAFYQPVRDGFAASQLTRGPWSVDHQHGGPPSALLGRALEAELASRPELQIVRVSIDFIRPIPIAALSLVSRTLRAGKKVALVEAELCVDGVPHALCRALAIRRLPLSVPPVETPPLPPAPNLSKPFSFSSLGDLPGYHQAMEVRFARGEFARGPAAAWFRARLPLLPGEALSPLCRVLLAADSGNGVGVVLDLATTTFVNPDVSVSLLALPRGEWVGLDTVTTPGPQGIGLVTSRLFDEHAYIGQAVQSLVIDPRSR